MRIRARLAATCAATIYAAGAAPIYSQSVGAGAPSSGSELSDKQAAPSVGDQARSGIDNAIQEIIVTARQRNEALMTVPVSVTAISGATLQRANATNLESIAELVPQLEITRSTGGAGGSITLRGLGTAAGDASLEQSISINIDGVQVNRGTIISQGFFDLGQVEVLKGPQALFFGKNSPGGVISLISANPTDTLSGYVRAGYEFDARQRYGEAAIGGPLSDVLKARIAVRGSKMDGYVRNTAVDLTNNPFYPGMTTRAGPARNGGEEALGRLTLIYTPSSDFDATFKAAGSTFKDNGAVNQPYCPGSSVPLVTPNGFTSIPDPYGDCKVDGHYDNAAVPADFAATIRGARNGSPYTLARAGLLSLTMNYHFAKMTLTSVTGLLGLSEKGANAISFSTYALFYDARGEKTRNFTQELRLVSNLDGPFDFTIGGFYENDRRTSTSNAALTGSLFRDPATGKYVSYENYNTNHGNTYSGFGQLRWRFLESLELAGGVRYTRETKNVVSVNRYVNPFTAAFLNSRAQGDPLLIPVRNSNWSPEATLSWKPRDGTLVYAAYKTGYKSGGAANPSRLSANQSEAQTRYGPEKSRGGEVGLKTYLADRTVRIEATAYSYLYKDLQVSIFDVSVPPTGAFYITNAAAARLKGIELSGEWNVGRRFRLNGSATYNDAKYKSFPTAVCYIGQTAAEGCVGGTQNLAGFPLTRAPKWTFAGGGAYDVPLSGDIKLGFGADAKYSSSYNTEEDFAPGTRQGGFWLFNAGLRLFDDKRGWEIAFTGRNLANKYYLKACNARFLAGQFYCENVRARELNLQVGYKF